MTRKKRAWGPSNPLWRWQHRSGGTARKHSKRRSYSMARRKHGYRRGKSGGRIFGLSTRGLVGGLGLLGVGAAVLFSDQIGAMVPINVPYKNYGVAFALGGPAGLAGKVVKDMVMPSGTVGTSVSGGW